MLANFKSFLLQQYSYTIYFFCKLIGRQPYFLLQIESRFFSFILLYIFKYRKKVVEQNLKKSFSEKDLSWIKVNRNLFYKHLVQQFFDSLKLLSISKEKILEHIHLENEDIIYQLKEEGYYQCFLLMGHYGYWDYFTATPLLLSRKNILLYQVYRPLHSKVIDGLMLRIRNRFGAFSVAQNIIGRKVIQFNQGIGLYEEQMALVVFIADPSPAWVQIKFFTPFLNQDTAFVTGAEELARKYEIPVVYMDLLRNKSNDYTGKITLITKNAAQEEPFFITRKYIQLLEKTIKRNPPYWLWSHKRWKHKPSDYPNKPIYPPLK